MALELLHPKIRQSFGVDEGLIDQLDDLNSTKISTEMKATLAHAKKLTETPSKMVQVDADLLYEAGLDEAALMNIVEITTVFGMYNLIADGTGVIAADNKTTLTKKKLVSYIDNLVKFGIKVPEDLKNLV